MGRLGLSGSISTIAFLENTIDLVAVRNANTKSCFCVERKVGILSLTML